MSGDNKTPQNFQDILSWFYNQFHELVQALNGHQEKKIGQNDNRKFHFFRGLFFKAFAIVRVANISSQVEWISKMFWPETYLKSFVFQGSSHNQWVGLNLLKNEPFRSIVLAYKSLSFFQPSKYNEPTFLNFFLQTF